LLQEEDEEEEAERGDAEKDPACPVEQNQPKQGTAATQEDVPAEPPSDDDDNILPNPSYLPTIADIDHDHYLERLGAEFDRRVKKMKTEIKNLPDPVSGEKLAKGALSLNVDLGDLKKCLLDMGVILSPEATEMGGSR
jgi:hypothetical protein